MKKLLRNIVILLLPIVAYYCVFVIFEPNNYFGLRKNATGTDIMANLRNFEDDPAEAVILGDSRMAKFDLEEVRRITGMEYASLAYGGASLKEQLDILDWTLEQNPAMRQVVFGVSFYTLNKGYSLDRNVLNALNNPFVYATNLGYNLNMVTNLIDHLAPNRQVGAAGETMNPADYVYVEYTDPASGKTVPMRKTIAEHLQGVVPRSEGWALNEEQLQRLLNTIAVCEEKGIDFVVVLPPMHEDVMQYVVEAFSIPEKGMQKALQSLYQSGAVVEDYEFANREALSDTEFYDGFHLDEERGQPVWTQMLFGSIVRQTA